MNILDTIVWLANLPASRGYVFVFISAFSLFGLIGAAAAGATPTGALRRIREREGLLRSDDRPRGQVLLRLRRIVFQVLAVVMLVSGVIGLLGLVGVPVTRAYIYDNGRPTTGVMDGDWVTFTTADGREYTLENNFFSPSVYPDRDAWLGSDEVVVRYLPDHPQAFVIDSSQAQR